ncbi:MAG TPA: hypothetical protein VK138_14160 [Acidiferrobacterales bacterium]|nr:hypothetical protein [Acidiferrobacterales bacterium]
MRRLTLTLLLIAVGLGTAHGAESDVTIVSGLDFGFKDMRLDFTSASNVFNPSFVTINPSIALGYKSFYASLSYDKSISADPSTGQALDMTSGAPIPTATITDYSRADSTFTLGYRLNQSFSLFAGYTQGASNFTETRVVTTPAVPSPSITTLIVTDVEYTETGPFAGVGYSKTFGDKGTLGLSIGYAQLDGELQVAVHPGTKVTRFKGDTTGLSYGLTWSGPLTGSLGYRVGVKATKYQTKDLDDLTERYTSFFLGITNYF